MLKRLLAALCRIIDHDLLFAVPAQHQLGEAAEIGVLIHIHQCRTRFAVESLNILGMQEIVVRQSHVMPCLMGIKADEIPVLRSRIDRHKTGRDMTDLHAVRFKITVILPGCRPPVVFRCGLGHTDEHTVDDSVLVAVERCKVHETVMILDDLCHELDLFVIAAVVSNRMLRRIAERFAGR